MRDPSAAAFRVAVAFITLLPGFVFTEDEDVKLPSYVETCYRDDPKVAECIKRNIEHLAPMFRSGSKDFDMDSLEPMQFSQIVLVYNSSLAGGHLLLPNMQIRGITRNIKVLDVRSSLKNPNKLSIDFDMHIPLLNIKLDYKLTGNLVAVPIDADGRLDCDFMGINASFHIRGHTVEEGDSTVLALDGFTWNLIGDGIEEARVNNDDLINGFPGLNRLAKTVLRTQWRTLRTHVMPSILRERQLTFTELFTNLFKKYPYDILFPRRTRIAVQNN